MTSEKIEHPPALLVLADGTAYRGRLFGAHGEAGGEVVFNTSMTGYQEVLTDPSYYGQMVTMTYPLIGNYGISPEDLESQKIQVAGFIVKEPSARFSNWRAGGSLEDWMKAQGITGLYGIDTRALVRRLRIGGVTQGIISADIDHPDDLLEKARALPDMAGQDLVKYVTTDHPYLWEDSLLPMGVPLGEPVRKSNGSKRVVAIDFGVKRNILRHLIRRGCEVRVVPAFTPAEDILALGPHCVFLSNGPGDPEPVTYAIETVRSLMGRLPIFGICLGHQIIGLAAGGRTYKLKFGHRGGNQPVQDLSTGKVEITAQNHGFCVDKDSLAHNKHVKVTHINLNDQTVEGLECREMKYFSVQYHPEASPGPHDATYHFDRFLDYMENNH
ncbi:MAG TPA: glutamine-hydrolyzing carbamoyl-phosphate synthase small subunit [bacterium]|nr:glutamine-hydrolyzing carbamoyl-phosphate synthase small subunit [bacterium]